MTPAELESLACRTLRCLPEPVAPSALLPQVLAQIERAGRRPWYRRSWRAWPPVWLVATAAVTLAAVQLGIDGLDRVEGHLPPLLGAAGALWRLVIQPNAALSAGCGLRHGCGERRVLRGDLVAALGRSFETMKRIMQFLLSMAIAIMLAAAGAFGQESEAAEGATPPEAIDAPAEAGDGPAAADGHGRPRPKSIERFGSDYTLGSRGKRQRGSL